MALTDVTLIANRALNDTATDDSTSTVGEPSVAVSGRNLFVTGNWYASSSTDAGATWTHVDPFNALPSAAGGFCCDQLTLHDHRRSRWIWILQYSQASNTNVFRLAAKRDENFPGGGWYWWDIGPGLLNAAWNNLWFDYPDASISEGNLYVTFNVFNSSDQWQRAVVMRFPLDTIANAGTLVFDWWSTTDVGSLRLTQGAGSVMYFGSHRSTTSLRLFRWADAEGNVTWWDIPVAEWSASISSTAPNGVDWLARADSRITGAALAHGVLTFMWTGGARANRPHPYCRAVRINESTRQVIDQPDLYSNDRAWAYPALAPNGFGSIGVTAFYGGVDRHPGHVVGVRDDAGSTWRTVYSRLGTHSPSAGRWGDYLNCRAGSPDGRTWVASGYTLEGGEDRQSIVPRTVHFRFGGATPPRLVVGNFAYDAGGWRVDKHPRFLADVTGDRRADIVGFGDAGAWVSLSNGDGTFTQPVLGVDNFAYSAGGWRIDKHPRFLADVTGDGRADIVGFGDAGVWVSLSNGDGTFTQPVMTVSNFAYSAGGWRIDKHLRGLADITGDRRADIVGFGDAGVWVSLF